MIAWLLFGFFAFGMVFASIWTAHRWGRGAHSGMSPKMEAEAANYVNYGRGPHGTG